MAETQIAPQTTTRRPWRHDQGVSGLKHYRRLVRLGLLDTLQQCKANANESELRQAAAGIYLRPDYLNSRDKNELCHTLVNALENRSDPVVYPDSLTAVLNDAVARYALRIKDITAMNKGERLHVLLLDRNIGDSLHGTKRGSSIILSRAIKRGDFLRAWYTHESGLTGTLDMYEIGVVHEPFTWELNQERIGGPFWGPIVKNDDGCCTSEDEGLPIDYTKLDPNTKVGWRGPAIAMSDVEKLPRTFRHYGTWWNDYAPWLQSDMTNLARDRPVIAPEASRR